MDVSEIPIFAFDGLKSEQHIVCQTIPIQGSVSMMVPLLSLNCLGEICGFSLCSEDECILLLPCSCISAVSYILKSGLTSPF